MTPATELARLMELDGMRSQGRWYTDQHYGDAGGLFTVIGITRFGSEVLDEGGFNGENLAFVLAAPDMVALLRWYANALRQAREALERISNIEKPLPIAEAWAQWKVTSELQSESATDALAATAPTKPLLEAK